MNTARKLIYTCVFAGYDELRPPLHPSTNLDFVCVTDDASLSVPGWEIRVLDMAAAGIEGLDATRQSRYAKILPHRMFPDYDLSLYVDSNLELIGPVEKLFAHLDEHDLVFYRHPENRCDVYDEAAACIRLSKDDPSCIEAHTARYRAAGFEGKSDPSFPTIPTAMVILRNHGNAEVVDTMEFWWREYLGGSRRDQMSLPYVLHASGQPHTLLDEYVRSNEFFEWRAHDSVQAARDARMRFVGADAVIMYSRGSSVEGLEGAIETARQAARGAFEKLAARVIKSVSRRPLGRKLAVGPSPRIGDLARLTPEAWGRSLCLSGVPIAYVTSKTADSDQKRIDGQLGRILRSHDAPTVVVAIEDLRGGISGEFLEWCGKVGALVDGQVLSNELREDRDRPPEAKLGGGDKVTFLGS